MYESDAKRVGSDDYTVSSNNDNLLAAQRLDREMAQMAEPAPIVDAVGTIKMRQLGGAAGPRSVRTHYFVAVDPGDGVLEWRDFDGKLKICADIFRIS
jgi:hypothetical protein